MAFEHPSGVADAFSRAPARPSWSEVVVREGRFAQAAEINELQDIERRRNRRVGDLIAKDGDRVEGCNINVSLETFGEPPEPADPETMLVTIAAGRIYIAGDVLPVAASSFAGLPVNGETIIGVRLIRTIVTEADDPALLGLAPGAESEGEPGAARLVSSISWALTDDEGDGDFYGVYLIKDGAVIDQTPPPALSGVTQQIARYDFDANANYVVDGCMVTALGKTVLDQIFAISSGTANITGFKRIRESSIRHAETEAPDLEAIAAEPHTFTGATGGTSVIPVLRPPIAAVQSAIVVKRVTEVVVRGATPNGADALGFSSIVAIESVVQGGTTYVATTDYVLVGNTVSWSPGGAEPANASTYSVTYRYNAAVTPDAVTDTAVTLTGGVNGTTALITYTSKLPRIDILCLDVTGRPVYVKGISARAGGLAPLPPSNLLKLAEVYNDWLGTPSVVNNGTRNFTYDEQRRLFTRLIDILEQFERSNMRADVTALDPVAKRGIFTDAFVDDFYRDQGEAQTAAVNRGVLQLAIDDVMIQILGTTVETLPFTEEIIVRQDLATSSIEINPYDNFVRMPAGMTLAPAVDFWTDEATEWTSGITREFTAAPNEPPGQTTINEVTEIRRVNAATLRQIAVTVTLEGFGVGENLATLTFDGVDVKPAGTQTGDADGEITLTFTIPAGIPTGRRLVRATGAVDSFAQAIYVGEGTVDITTMRRVTLITRAAPDPINVVNNIINVTNNTTVINQAAVATLAQAVVDNGPTWIGGAGGDDPLAQTFTLPEPRHIIGLNFRFTAIGNRTNGVRVQLAGVANGFPTREILAECFINMQTQVVGALVEARFGYPVFLPADREFCFVIMTADPDHAVAIAKLGDIDVPLQRRVSAQPYTVGVLLTSANRLTWTPFQEADLFFQIVAAKFTATTRTFNLWTGPFDAISDVIVRGVIELPTDAATFRYELVRATGQVIPLAPGQTREFSEFVSENVTLRAVMTGTANISPVLFPGSLLIGGRIRTTGTYVTRAFTIGSAARVAALFAAALPAGSNVTVDVDAADDDWEALASTGSGVLGGGWNEPRYEIDPYTAAVGRIRVTLTGGPGARPAIARMRAYSV